MLSICDVQLHLISSKVSSDGVDFSYETNVVPRVMCLVRSVSMVVNVYANFDSK